MPSIYSWPRRQDGAGQSLATGSSADGRVAVCPVRAVVRDHSDRHWHVRFRAELAVYRHLHIPRTSYYDGVRFEEASLGYP